MFLVEKSGNENEEKEKNTSSKHPAMTVLIFPSNFLYMCIYVYVHTYIVFSE